jgi:hypothetical protein
MRSPRFGKLGDILQQKAHRKRPNLPRASYYRAGVLVKNVAEIARALRPRPTRKGGTAMTAAMAYPETVYMQPVCDLCKDFEAEGLWWEEEKDAACQYNDCPNNPVTYIRADLFDAQVKRMEENALDYIDETGLRIATLNHLLRKARDRLDAFADADLMDEINSALGKDMA